MIFIIDIPVYFYFFQKLLKDSSDLLYTALNKKAFLKAVTIVVPSTWRDSKCQRIIHSPREDTPYRFVARILNLKKNCLNQKSGKTFFLLSRVLNNLGIKNLVFGKGQVISKADWHSVDSPKKQTDEFDLFALKSKKANKSNSSVCFFGEVSRS